jgi:4-hydroxybenzoate polyprenyltransferase
LFKTANHKLKLLKKLLFPDRAYGTDLKALCLEIKLIRINSGSARPLKRILSIGYGVKKPHCTPLTHFQIRQLVIRILSLQGDHDPLGKHWVTRFLAHAERIRTLKAVRVEYKRIEGSKATIIRTWFHQLKDPEITVIRSCNRWNMDETGIFQGVGINGLVIGQSEKKKTLKKSPHRRSWVTITEAICADGTALLPFVIFKGDQPQQQWFPKDPSFLGNWHFATSPKGWTTNEISALWLEKVFIPYTLPKKEGEKRLIFLDGHESHLTD